MAAPQIVPFSLPHHILSAKEPAFRWIRQSQWRAAAPSLCLLTVSLRAARSLWDGAEAETAAAGRDRHLRLCRTWRVLQRRLVPEPNAAVFVPTYPGCVLLRWVCSV